jgi:hypothetical protein
VELARTEAHGLVVEIVSGRGGLPSAVDNTGRRPDEQWRGTAPWGALCGSPTTPTPRNDRGMAERVSGKATTRVARSWS